MHLRARGLREALRKVVSMDAEAANSVKEGVRQDSLSLSGPLQKAGPGGSPSDCTVRRHGQAGLWKEGGRRGGVNRKGENLIKTGSCSATC